MTLLTHLRVVSTTAARSATFLPTLRDCSRQSSVSFTSNLHRTQKKLQHAENMLEFLHEKLELDKSEKQSMKIALRVPTKCNQQELNRLLNGLRTELKLTKPELRRSVQKFPQLLGQDYDDSMEKFKWLQKRLELSDANLKLLIQRLPQIFGYDKEKNLKITLDWLQHRLNLKNEELRQFVLRLPQVLGLSIEGNIAPTINFYEKNLGVKKAIEWVSNDPSLLGYSLDNRLSPRLEQARDLQMTIDSELVARIAKHTSKKWEEFLTNYEEEKQKTDEL